MISSHNLKEWLYEFNTSQFQIALEWLKSQPGKAHGIHSIDFPTTDFFTLKVLTHNLAQRLVLPITSMPYQELCMKVPFGIPPSQSRERERTVHFVVFVGVEPIGRPLLHLSKALPFASHEAAVASHSPVPLWCSMNSVCGIGTHLHPSSFLRRLTPQSHRSAQ